MPEKNNIKIWEQKWFWPVVLVAVVVAGSWAIYVSLNTKIEILTGKVNSLEKMIYEFSKAQEVTIPVAVPSEEITIPGKKITEPQTEIPATREETLVPEEIPIE